MARGAMARGDGSRRWLEAMARGDASMYFWRSGYYRNLEYTTLKKHSFAKPGFQDAAGQQHENAILSKLALVLLTTGTANMDCQLQYAIAVRASIRQVRFWTILWVAKICKISRTSQDGEEDSELSPSPPQVNAIIPTHVTIFQ
eukprot:6196422-Pleurochrysis_carterae.AAC.1